MDLATFGGGCFWHVEESFRKLKGVISTSAGYMGGKTKDPTYDDVCSNLTGHAEVVQIKYDPDMITYKDLLKIFWDIHNPCEVDRQGADEGTQYRSVIFYHTSAQKKEAELSKSKIKNAVTEIKKSSRFYKAEEYHQKYVMKHKMCKCFI